MTTVNEQPDFFAPTIYQPSRVLRPADLAPPRATLRQRHPELVYLARGMQTAAAVALTAVLALPTQSVTGSESAQIIRPHLQRRPTPPRKVQLEAVDHRRVQMRPRQVLIFRPVVKPTKALPRPYRDDSED
jgi:hypothetical protein